MATFTPSKKNITDFNGGEEYQNGSGLQAETINNIIESQLYTQGLAKNAPNVTEANQEGTATVTIEQTADGTPRLKFANLKGATGEKGEKGDKGDTGSIANLEEQVAPLIEDKADKYKTTSTKFANGTAINVGDDLSGKTIVFNPNVSYNYGDNSQPGWGAMSTYLTSSGRYSIESGGPPDLYITDKNGIPSVYFWYYDQGTGDVGWQMSSYTLPDDFGTVNFIDEKVANFIRVAGEIEVDCEYNFREIEGITPSGIGALSASDLLLKVYPAGSIYMSTNSTSPATFVGGTWTRIQDRFLVSVGSNFGAGATGGYISHIHALDDGFAKMYIGTLAKYGGSTFGIATDNNPATPTWTANRATRGTSSSGTMVMDYSYNDTAVVSGAKLGGSTNENSSLPPYIAVYMWKRTA